MQFTIKHTQDLGEFHTQSMGILRQLASDKILLRKLVLNLPNQPDLFAYSEHYDILDKIVLFVSEDQKIRVRLHVFSDEYYDRPHNHRWTYSSYILSGGYIHSIFVPCREKKDLEIGDIKQVMLRHERSGGGYTLHHSQYHSVVADPNTVSLIYRGPSEKDRFRLFDSKTGESWWQYGAASETKEEKNTKQMSLVRFEKILQKLEQLEII